VSEWVVDGQRGYALVGEQRFAEEPCAVERQPDERDVDRGVAQAGGGLV